MLKGLRLVLGLKKLTEAQTNSIGDAAYARLQALRAKQQGGILRYEKGAMALVNDAGEPEWLDCRFQHPTEWGALLENPLLSSDPVSYENGPKRYSFRDPRVMWPPVFNVYYWDGDTEIDLGAIQA